MTITKCFILTENNDNEGESWNFYVPLADNELAYELIAEKLMKAEAEDFIPYELAIEDLDLNTIRRLPDRPGYMSSHNIIEGIINIKKLRTADWSEDPLYKGGLFDFTEPRLAND